MKLFQQMLVAGASLSLLAPVAAQANDIVNVEEMNSYVRSTKKQSSRIDSKTFINEVSEDIANFVNKCFTVNFRRFFFANRVAFNFFYVENIGSLSSYWSN